MPEIIVGTCGFSKSRRLIFENLDAVEVQETFYDPPPSERLRRIREEAPDGFIITMKAWMLVTHKYNKMLWRRLRRNVPGSPDRYGWFQDTEEVWWAWRETLRAARDLDASVIVLQTPATFGFSEENLARVENFLSKADRDDRMLAWEPRGAWWDHRDVLHDISKKHNVIIAGDYLRGRVSTCHASVGYARLHGLGGKEVNYKYKYTDEDLMKLLNIINNTDCSVTYVMFNNVYSYYDAVRFKRLLDETSL